MPFKFCVYIKKLVESIFKKFSQIRPIYHNNDSCPKLLMIQKNNLLRYDFLVVTFIGLKLSRHGTSSKTPFIKILQKYNKYCIGKPLPQSGYWLEIAS